MPWQSRGNLSTRGTGQLDTTSVGDACTGAGFFTRTHL